MCRRGRVKYLAAISDNYQHFAVLKTNYDWHKLIYYNLQSGQSIEIEVEENIKELQEINFSADNKLYYIFMKFQTQQYGIHYFDTNTQKNIIIHLGKFLHNITANSDLTKYLFQEDNKCVVKTIDQHYQVSITHKSNRNIITPTQTFIFRSRVSNVRFTKHCKFIIYIFGFDKGKLTETKKFKLINKGKLGLNYISNNVLNQTQNNVTQKYDQMQVETASKNNLLFKIIPTIIREIQFNGFIYHPNKLRKSTGMMVEF